MDVKVMQTSQTASQRALADQKNGIGLSKINMAAGKSPLSRAMNDVQANWLIQYVTDRWIVLHRDIGPWRTKMEKWEEMSEGDYHHRRSVPTPNQPEMLVDVFAYQNDTLGMTEGFVDFTEAQGTDDLFGTRPWLAAIPEGSDDSDLAELITRHAQWKFNQSNLEAVLKDAIDISCWGGTAFVKSRFVTKTEDYVRSIHAAHSKTTGEPFLGPDGDFVTTTAGIPDGTDGDDVEWTEIDVKETRTVKKNVCASCVDWRDIAFDMKAIELDLDYTDVFTRVRMGLLDVATLYNIEDDEVQNLRALLINPSEEARARRGETNTSDKVPQVFDNDANPMISLVEGYLSCDPLRTGSPVRIQVVFSPELQIMFSNNYLANITPDGILPIAPVRVHKIATRVFGRGYFEKYEGPNNAVDRHYNAVAYRDQLASNIFVGVNRQGLLKPDGEVNLIADSRTPIEVGPDKKITDVLTFTAMPDNHTCAIELMNLPMIYFR